MKSFSYNYMILYITLYLCLISFDILQSGCHSQEFKVDLTSDSTNDILDTINTLKETVKDVNLEKDAPQVSEWMEDCKEIVGGRTWRTIRTSPKRVFDCISEHINYKKVKAEVNESMARGDLDLVFKKYCGRREEIMGCVDGALELVKPCMNDQQLIDLNITRNAIDAAIDFTCYENGDRIALFMAEDGVPCLKNTSDAIKECIQDRLPEVKEAENDLKSIKLDQFLINDDNCKKISVAQHCVVTATTSCDDPTPSNILDSLITQALKATPCAQTSAFALNASTGFYLHFWALLPHVLTLILAGLTAAHILL